MRARPWSRLLPRRRPARGFGLFIESWFGKLKERLVWRSELETLDQARREMATYIHSYYHRPACATERERRYVRRGKMDND